MCSAWTSSSPSGVNSAAEQSARSLMLGLNAARRSTAPISSATPVSRRDEDLQRRGIERHASAPSPRAAPASPWLRWHTPGVGCAPRRRGRAPRVPPPVVLPDRARARRRAAGDARRRPVSTHGRATSCTVRSRNCSVPHRRHAHGPAPARRLGRRGHEDDLLQLEARLDAHLDARFAPAEGRTDARFGAVDACSAASTSASRRSTPRFARMTPGSPSSRASSTGPSASRPARSCSGSSGRCHQTSLASAPPPSSREPGPAMSRRRLSSAPARRSTRAPASPAGPASPRAPRRCSRARRSTAGPAPGRSLAGARGRAGRGRAPASRSGPVARSATTSTARRDVRSRSARVLALKAATSADGQLVALPGGTGSRGGLDASPRRGPERPARRPRRPAPPARRRAPWSPRRRPGPHDLPPRGAASSPDGRQHAGPGRHDHRVHPQRVGQRAGVQRSGTAERDQREAPRVDAPLHRHGAQGPFHVGVDDGHHARRPSTPAPSSAGRAARVEPARPGNGGARRDAPGNEVGVGHRGPVPPRP